MRDLTKKSEQSEPKEPVATSAKPIHRKSRIRVAQRPFKLYIDDTLDNVARAIFGKPLQQDKRE